MAELALHCIAKWGQDNNIIGRPPFGIAIDLIVLFIREIFFARNLTVLTGEDLAEEGDEF